MKKLLDTKAKKVYFGVLLYLFSFSAAQMNLGSAAMLMGIDIEEGAVLGSLMLWSLIPALTAAVVWFRTARISPELKTVRRMGIGRFLAFCAVIYVIQLLMMMFIQELEVVLNEYGWTSAQSAALTEDYTRSAALLLYMAVIGPMAEELIFRGYLLKGLSGYGKIFALVVSSLMFGLMHGDLQQALFAPVIGLLLGYTALQYGIVYSVLLHMFNNAFLGWVFTDAITWLQEKYSETAAEMAVGIFGVLCLLFAVIYAVVKRREIGAWLRKSRSAPGAWKNLKSIWLLLFVLAELAMVALNIQPV